MDNGTHSQREVHSLKFKRRELKLTHVSGMEKAYINFLMRTRCEICAAPFKFGAGFLGSLAYTQMLGILTTTSLLPSSVSAITQLFDLIPQGWLNMLRPLESLFPIIEHSNLTISQQLLWFWKYARVEISINFKFHEVVIGSLCY
ncbi:hypothetical protein P8452_15903 [Trifolium repens]|nr:hypothetical protein P8452_15903 [Trifolium repens]